MGRVVCVHARACVRVRWGRCVWGRGWLCVGRWVVGWGRGGSVRGRGAVGAVGRVGRVGGHGRTGARVDSVTA